MSRSATQQDYIVRQRYSNALPPPPGAPKLLDIPTGGLKQYTMPTYASRLARIQPLNIEADADLGMPIDLVGMGKVFEGDDSAILAPLSRPPVHPGDRDLLRPLKEIGQAKKEGGIAFLRRTQYIGEASGTKVLAQNLARATPKRRRLDAPKDDPKTILRNVIKGFDLANPEDAQTGPGTDDNFRGAQPTQKELDAWRKPTHPVNPNVKPLDFYPILPDLEAIPPDGGYTVARFSGHPEEIEGDRIEVPVELRGDPRLETAILQSLAASEQKIAEYNELIEKHKADPATAEHPGAQPSDFQYFVPDNLEVAFKAIQGFDPDETPVDKVDDTYTDVGEEGKRYFKFKHARYYETNKAELHTGGYERVALALYDGEEEDDDLGLGDERTRKLPKAAYYAPTLASTHLKPRRKIDARPGQSEPDEDRIDILTVRVTEMAKNGVKKDEAGDQLEDAAA